MAHDLLYTPTSLAFSPLLPGIVGSETLAAALEEEIWTPKQGSRLGTVDFSPSRESDILRRQDRFSFEESKT